MARPPARGPLRVATFNVGILSTFTRNADRGKDLFGAVTEGLVNLILTDSDAAQLGRRVAERVLEAPYDVVVLNELFHADARSALIDKLTDSNLPDGVVYPWVRTGFGPEERTPAAGNPHPSRLDDISENVPASGVVTSEAIGVLRSLLDDSGLLVASRLPLQAFTLDGVQTDWAFTRYSESSPPDSLAPKGAGAVVVQAPGYAATVVAFTHLQAEYHDSVWRTVQGYLEAAHGQASYAGIRQSQLEQLVWLARGVGDVSGTQNVVVLGDLNIRGEDALRDPNDGSEYHTVFSPTGVLGQLGEDGWRDGACGPYEPPGDDWFDPSISYPEDQQRLDYIVAGRLDSRRGRTDLPLAIQHLLIARNLDEDAASVSSTSPIGLDPSDLAAPRGHVQLSDHVGVNAVIGGGAGASAPRYALKVPPGPDSIVFNDVPHGELRWLALGQGAYRISAVDLDLEVYEATNVAVALANAARKDASAGELRAGVRYPAVDHPLLVRLHHTDPGRTQISTTVRKIEGATPDDAVPIRPSMPTPPTPWPQAAQGHIERGRWFELVLDSPSPGAEQIISIDVRSKTDDPGGAATVEIFPGTSIDTPPNDFGQPAARLSTRSASDPPSASNSYVVSGTGDRDLSFLVTVIPHPNVETFDAVVELSSNLRLLLSSSFTAIDETGIDASGADEIRWTIRSDLLPPGGVALSGYEDDVDTGESYAMSLPAPEAFVDHVEIKLTEEAGAASAESANFVVSKEDPADVRMHQTHVLPDDIKDGMYAVDYTIARAGKYA